MKEAYCHLCRSLSVICKVFDFNNMSSRAGSLLKCQCKHSWFHTIATTKDHSLEYLNIPVNCFCPLPTNGHFSLPGLYFNSTLFIPLSSLIIVFANSWRSAEKSVSLYLSDSQQQDPWVLFALLRDSQHN